MTTGTEIVQFKLGWHVFPKMDGIAAAFGADEKDYPKRGVIPDEHYNMRSAGCQVASALFFNGGSLSDHGLRLKSDVDAKEFHHLVRALLCSFAPKHEVKIGTVGWLIEEYTEPASVTP